MGFLIILAVLTLIALLAFIFIPRKIQTTSGYGNNASETRVPKLVAGGVFGALLVLTGLFMLFDSFYSQDTGDASVQIDWTGNIVGQETTPGLHLKAPWVHVETFNVRNQSVQYAADGKSDNAGNLATGPQITVQDADGVSSNIDINLRYSIRPDQVTAIYKQYKTEDNFKTSFIQNDVRSVVRTVPNTFHTLDLLTQRNKIEGDVLSALEARWKNTGVTVDSVSLQEIRVPDAVKEQYSEAVKSQIKVTQAKNELAAAQVSAQQQVVQAQAKAKANDLLAKSLTGPVLQQNYIDTLKSLSAAGNLVVVPSGSNPLINVGK